MPASLLAVHIVLALLAVHIVLAFASTPHFPRRQQHFPPNPDGQPLPPFLLSGTQLHPSAERQHLMYGGVFIITQTFDNEMPPAWQDY